MKTSIIALVTALVCLVSLVTADHQPATVLTSDQITIPDQDLDTNQDSSDQDTTISNLGTTLGSGLHASIIPVGIITNKVDANNNNVLVTKSNIHLSKRDHVQLAKTIKEELSDRKEVSPLDAMSTEDSGAVVNPDLSPSAISTLFGGGYPSTDAPTTSL